MGIKNLFMKKGPDDIKVGDLKKDNALDLFLNTLSEEDRNKNIVDLTEDQIHNYIKAIYLFQIEVIPDLLDCAGKALSILCHKAYKANVDSFDIGISFNGTIEGVSEENFLFSFVDRNKKMPSLSVDKNDGNETNEYDDENYNKKSLLIDQKEQVLKIYNHVKATFMDENGKDSTFLTSGLMILFETMSSLNLETKYSSLSGLILKDEVIENTYDINMVRQEVIPDFKPKFKLH